MVLWVGVVLRGSRVVFMGSRERSLDSMSFYKLS
jgi:hypothetical protein